MDLFTTKNRKFLWAHIAVMTNPATRKKLAGFFDNKNYHIIPSGINGANFVIDLPHSSFNVKFEIKDFSSSSRLKKLADLILCNYESIEEAYQRGLVCNYDEKSLALSAYFEFGQYMNKDENPQQYDFDIIRNMCLETMRLKQVLSPYLLLVDNSTRMQENIGISNYQYTSLSEN
ncbi:MAG: hypothetical protein AB7I27_00260 [Bacteriovoracaceae bacterium]